MNPLRPEQEITIGEKTYTLTALNVRQILSCLRSWGGIKVGRLRTSLLGQGLDGHSVAAIVAEQEAFLTSTQALIQMADCFEGQIKAVSLATAAPESEVETLPPGSLARWAALALGGEQLGNS